MPFDLKIWRERTAQRLEVLRTQILQRSAPQLLYAALCEAALWPLVEAAQQGAWLLARAILDQVAPGVGGKLLAGQIQRWQEGADASEMAAWVAAAAPGHTALQEALDAILRQTEAVAKVRAGLPEDDRAWFERRLSEELTQLGHSPSYQAWLEGAGAVGTGETPTVFDQREQQVHTQINVAGDYDDHRQQGGHYTVVIEHASGLAIGDGAQVILQGGRESNEPPAGGAQLVRKYVQHTYHVNAITLSPDEALMASCSGDQRAIVWFIATGEVVANLKHNRWVGSLCFTQDGNHLITSDGNGVLRLWDVQSGTLIKSQQAHEGACRTVVSVPNTSLIASGGGDAQIKFWNASDLTLVNVLEAHTAEVRRIAFHIEGRTFVSGGEDGAVYLWSLEDKSFTPLLQSKNTLIRSVAYAPDGTTVAITDSQGVVGLWDATNRIFRWRVQAHEGPAVGVTFHPNSRIVVTGGQDRLIRLWDSKSGNLINSFLAHEDTVTCMAFFKDGKRLISASRDKSLRLWRI